MSVKALRSTYVISVSSVARKSSWHKEVLNKYELKKKKPIQATFFWLEHQQEGSAARSGPQEAPWTHMHGPLGSVMPLDHH